MSAKPLEERLAAFKNMTAADPENELAHFSLGKVHLEMGNLPEAEQSLRRALELNSEQTLPRQFLGETLLRLERKEEAVEVLREAILLAHDKGQWQPRNEMLERLQALGVEPPQLPEPREGPAESVAEAADSSSVSCRRCSQVGPRLQEPPFPNDLGKQIQEGICQGCWREWMSVSIKVINEYRLNLMLPEAQAVYDNHMCEFLQLGR